MKKISITVRDILSLKHNILALTSREIITKRFYRKVKSFRPQIIHYLHGPTIRSLIILRLLKSAFGINPKTIASATRPFIFKNRRLTIRLLKPDLILTQSLKFESFFKDKGCKVEFLPNGVNCNKFVPPTSSEKYHLREELGLPDDKKIILHVGHIKANRNLEIFKDIQRLDGFQVVIVGGTTEKTDEKLKKDLEKSGIKIFHRYFEDISQIYKMADLYVFPVIDTGNKFPLTYNQVGAIDLPLSIMEAMACNLPVITTSFGALSRLFKPGGGLYFFNNEEEIIPIIQQLSYKKEVSTRDKVLPFDWGKVIERLEKIYQEINL